MNTAKLPRLKRLTSTLLLAGLFLASCKTAPDRPLRPTPGQHLIDDAEDVWDDYDCEDRKLPFATLEESEIRPATVYAGEEFNHHFIYALCPARNAQPIIGTLYRRVYFNNQIVFQDVERNFILKPGKWSVDAFITTPPDAKPGVYRLSLAFNSRGINLDSSSNLTVQSKR